MRIWIPLACAALSMGAWPSNGKYAGGGSAGGITAKSAQSLVNAIGYNTHIFSESGLYTAATIIKDTNYLGIYNIRDNGPNTAPLTYSGIASAGGQFDALEGTNWNTCTGTYMGAGILYLATVTIPSLDTLIGLYPSSLPYVEGPNEINNQPACYLITAQSTGHSGAVINFSGGVPVSMQTVATAGYGSGVVVTDVTNPGAIPGSTTLVSTTSTSVTLSASTTITNGDTIQFEANETNPASGVAAQQDIYNAIRADTNLANTPVLNFTDYPIYGVAGTADRNNAHFYATLGSQPLWQANGQLPGTAIIPGLPMLVTETDWYTVNSGTDGVDQNTQARYTLNALFDLYTAFQVPQTYFYELLDEAADGAAGDNYGLFTNGNSPKVSATAIKNFVSIMSDSGPTFMPGQLSYSVSGLATPSGSWPTGDAGGYSALFQKSNGNFEIVLWNEPQIWNYASQLPVTPTPSSLTVNFGLTAATVNVYDPITGATPVSTASNVASISPSLGADPLIVEVIPVRTYAATLPPMAANVVASPSLPFTVTLGTGTFSGSQTITISDGGQGGTITPSVGGSGVGSVTVTPTNGSTSFTFTYAGASAGVKTISFSNAQGWADPRPLSYTSATPIPPYDGTVWNHGSTTYSTVAGTITHSTYHSNLLNVDVGYTIYLPPQYVSETTTHFPVVYFLSGGGGTENTADEVGLYTTVDAAIAASTIKPMIVVGVNGNTDGLNWDAQPGSPDYGTFAPMSMFIYEGIPQIDAAYRTIANGTGRALHGFSGGGQSCLKYAVKFRNMFSSAYCIAPAADDVAPNFPNCPPAADGPGASDGDCSTVTASEPTALLELYNNNTAEWQAETVWGAAARNAPIINGLPIQILVGGSDPLHAVEVDYMAWLALVGVAANPLLTAPGCVHDYPCDVAYVGANAPFIFFSTNFP